MLWHQMHREDLTDFLVLECVEDLVSLQIAVYHNQIKREGNADFNALKKKPYHSLCALPQYRVARRVQHHLLAL